VPAGMLSDKIGRERLIIFGYLMYSAIYFGFGRTIYNLVIIMMFALYGLYSAALYYGSVLALIAAVLMIIICVKCNKKD